MPTSLTSGIHPHYVRSYRRKLTATPRSQLRHETARLGPRLLNPTCPPRPPELGLRSSARAPPPQALPRHSLRYVNAYTCHLFTSLSRHWATRASTRAQHTPPHNHCSRRPQTRLKPRERNMRASVPVPLSQHLCSRSRQRWPRALAHRSPVEPLRARRDLFHARLDPDTLHRPRPHHRQRTPWPRLAHLHVSPDLF